MDPREPDRPEEPEDGLGWLTGDDEPEETEPSAPASSPQPEPEPEPEPEPAPEPAPEASDADPPTIPVAQPGPADDEPPGGGRSTLKLVLLSLPVVLLLLVGWTKLVSSDRYCASCHTMDTATFSAARSIHSDVSCISCHSGNGAVGAMKYVPTLLRESAATVTGLGLADGVLPARSCESCHTDLLTSDTLKQTHADAGTDCTSCHGEVSHPTLRVPGVDEVAMATDQGHPEGFIQTHGGVAIDQPSSCAECHQQKFCEACHLRETFPHPAGWITKHGKVQEERGATACATCHGPTFCAGCHGTEIPHRADWLGRHARDLQDASTTPCFTCHPPTDCTTCHSEHSVHREQDLFTFPPPVRIP